MMMSTIVLRRSGAMMAATTGRRAFSAQMAAPAASGFSTEDMEMMLKSLRWASLNDNVKEIRYLMNEPKTNYAIHKPDPMFQDQVAHHMKEIEDMIATSTKKEDVECRIGELKRMVKSKLYTF